MGVFQNRTLNEMTKTLNLVDIIAMELNLKLSRIQKLNASFDNIHSAMR